MWTRRDVVKTVAMSSFIGAQRLAYGAADTKLSPIVQTTDGRLQGAVEGDVFVFRGVPYGADTSGEGRFLPPRPAPKWRGVRRAVSFGDRSSYITASLGAGNRPAYDVWASFTDLGAISENCLVLNVWTPGLGSQRKRPVMVWLHPGGFFEGSGASPPTFGNALARIGDVVVVTLNHRLSPVGYVYLEGLDPLWDGAANVGQLDQIAALKWVQENIAAFGGDPDNITIFGQSGGGAKVCAHLATPSVQGLFHKAICQSGAYLQASPPDVCMRAARAMLEKLGIEADNVDALRSISLQSLVEAGDKAFALGLFRGLDPAIDGRILTCEPLSVASCALTTRIPLMIGSARTESTALEDDESMFHLDWSSLPEKWSSWYSRRIGPQGMIDRSRAMGQIEALRKAYPDESATDLYIRFTTDLWMTLNTIEFADMRSQRTEAPVYLYELAYKTPVDGGRWRSPHSLDVPLVFSTLTSAPSIVDDSASSRRVSEQMLSAWVSFAHTGDPNSADRVKWPRYNTKQRPAMIFDVDSSVEWNYRNADREIFSDVPTLSV